MPERSSVHYVVSQVGTVMVGRAPADTRGMLDDDYRFQDLVQCLYDRVLDVTASATPDPRLLQLRLRVLQLSNVVDESADDDRVPRSDVVVIN